MSFLVEKLVNLQANAVGMYAQAHGFHWNVNGPFFKELHAFFLEIYEDVFDSIDIYSENLRKLGALAPFGLRSWQMNSTIKFDETPTVDSMDMVKILIETNSKIIDLFSTTIISTPLSLLAPLLSTTCAHILLIPFFNLIDGEETEKNILDIGGGTNSFSLSTHIIDVFENKEKNIFKVDIDFEAFPFYNKQFLFSFCRHTLEDIQNPSNAFNEIIRVSQKGYIETPSPLAELTRGVEGNLVGYCHHRYIVWSERNKHLVFFT
jgi:starvation-inducible DNA-binding protein